MDIEASTQHHPPFDAARLDALMAEAGIDLLLVTSKPNVQYLLGGYRVAFFENFDAVGISRYLPVLIYPRGRPDQAAYIGARLEAHEAAVRRFWTPELRLAAHGTIDATELALDYLRGTGLSPRRIGVELGFLPADAHAALRAALPDAAFVEALPVLEMLRAVKTPRELGLLRTASERVVAAMLEVIGAHGPGATKHEIVEALRRAEAARGLAFDYCLITAGTSPNRAVSDQALAAGDILSLDSGGNYRGYIGDLCRMGVVGEPDAELVDLLAEVDTIQQAAMRPVRHGAPGGAVYEAAGKALAGTPNRTNLDFLAHGMGLVTHEVPHLTDRGPVPYSASDAGRPLLAGMVLSVETTLHHPARGFIKLEDTIAVTEDGFEMMGGEGRGWNRALS